MLLNNKILLSPKAVFNAFSSFAQGCKIFLGGKEEVFQANKKYFCLNPYTPSSGESKYLRKIPNFIFAHSAKQIAPCESTAKEISFE